MKTNKGMNRRFKEARLLNQMSVKEVIERLGISRPTLNAWESGRKSPSVDAVENLADLYGVTVDYLLGRPDCNKALPTAMITSDMLYSLNGQPVWSAKYGWMLVTAKSSALLCSDGSTIDFSLAGEVFASPAHFFNLADLENKPLTRDEISQFDEIWVEPISPDAALRNELRGWYKQCEHWVENDAANRLLYSAYGSKWIAFKGFLDL